MAFGRLAAIRRDAMDGIEAGIEGGAEKPQRSLLARPFRAFEDDEGAAAMDGLRRLQACEPLLQRIQCCRVVTSERRPPLDVGQVDRHGRGLIPCGIGPQSS